MFPACALVQQDWGTFHQCGSLPGLGAWVQGGNDDAHNHQADSLDVLPVLKRRGFSGLQAAFWSVPSPSFSKALPGP